MIVCEHWTAWLRSEGGWKHHLVLVLEEMRQPMVQRQLECRIHQQNKYPIHSSYIWVVFNLGGRLLFVLSSSLFLPKCVGALFSSRNQPVPLFRRQHYYFHVGKPCVCARSPPFLTLFSVIGCSPFPTLSLGKCSSN